jgi:DNA-binding response OmpR family regulator
MKKILLVNSTRHFFEEGKSLLDRQDFHVFQAPTADQALHLHSKEQVSLIVSDLDLPEMGGDVLCAKIRENTDSRDVSIILICHNTREEQARAARSSANACLFKPFPAKLLLEQVEKLLAVSVRKGYRVLLRARVQGEHDDAVFFCTSRDISTTGILIESDRPLNSGDRLSCSFYLPGAAHITTNGEVVRRVASESKPAYGVRFIDISTEHQQALDSFIAEAATD